MMNKRVLVTGAGRGIGLEMVRQLNQMGDEVFATVHTPDEAGELTQLSLAHPGKIHLVPLDVRDPSSIDACHAMVAARTRELDVVINNAGVGSRHIDHGGRNMLLGDLEPEGIVEMMRINAIGPTLVAQRFLDLLSAGNKPRIMNISSALGSISGKKRGGNYGYCASKAALNMFGRILAIDLQKAGVVVLNVDPGWVRTDMGGLGASLSPEQSVRGMLMTLENASLRDSGRFLRWDGAEEAW